MKFFVVFFYFFAVLAIIFSVMLFSSRMVLSEQSGFGDVFIDGVFVSSEFREDFNGLWLSNPDSEELLCLYGRIDKGTAIINRVVFAPVLYYDVPIPGDIGVVASRCKEPVFPFSLFVKSDLLGTLHNHPNGVCNLGEFDLYSFGASHNKLAGIVCGVDSIVFYTPNDVTSSVEVVLG